MPLDYQVAEVRFSGGLDTKSDPKLVVQGKLLALTNGIFTDTGQIRKRNGYDSINLGIIGGGTITNPKMVHSYNERMVVAANSNLYDYSTTLNRWKNAGSYDSIGVSNTFISGANQNERNSSSIVFGNYSIIAYDSWPNIAGVEAGTSLVSVYYSVIDLTTNTLLASDQTFFSGSANVAYSRVVMLGTTQPALFYFSTNGICCRTITISTSGVTLGSENILVASANVQTYGSGMEFPWISYDVVTTPTGASIGYSSNGTSSIEFFSVNTSGVQTFPGSGTISLSSTGLALPLSLVRDSTTTNIWVYWGTPASAAAAPGNNTTIKYAIVSSTFATNFGPISIGVNIPFVRQITAFSTSTTTQTVYFSSSTILGGLNIYDLVTSTTYSSNVTTSSSSPIYGTFLYNAEIYGKPFTINSKNYLPMVMYSPDQNSGFLMDLSDGHVAGKFLRDTAESAYSIEVNSNNQQGGYWWRYPGFLVTPAIYSSTQVIFAAGKIIQTLINNLAGGITNALYASHLMGVVLVAFDFNSIDANQALEANNVLVLNGSMVSQYDGTSVTELGFNYFPEFVGTSANTGGFITTGTYIIQIVYQWSDNQGNLHLSSPSDPVTCVITTGAVTTASITLKVKTLTLSQKNLGGSPVQIFIYRTKNGGTIPLLDTVVSNDPTVPFLTVVLTNSDTNLISSQPIYTNGGAIVPNDSVPSSMLLWLNNNRLWLIDSENPATNASYAKTFANLTGISFSDDLVYDIDPRLGNVIAGIAMDEKTIIVKQLGLLYFIGDGASDSGAGSTLTSSQIIPSDVGGSNSKAVFLIPQGVIFRASNNKGIFILSRGVQIGYFGADVEQFNSQDIQAIQMIGNKTQMRFLTSSGSSLLFDYFFNQWGTFTNHTGLSSTSWNGVYTYVRADGSLFTENSSTFLDNGSAFQLSMTSAWMKAAQTQNFERIRLVEILGDFTGGSLHGVQLQCAFDFNSSPLQTVAPYYFSTSSGVFQYRAFLPKQKCDAMQFILTELTTGASGEFIDFSDFGLEIGLKKGLNKLAAASTVG